LVPLQLPSPSLPTNSIENLSSTIQRDRVDNFGQFKSNEDGDMNEMIGRSRPYTQREFNQKESLINEINNSYEFLPSSNLILYENRLHEIPFYIDRNVTLTNLMISQGEQLAWLLPSLAKQVFHIPVQTMHLFRDIDSGKKIFN
jgi:hypothetical protein